MSGKSERQEQDSTSGAKLSGFHLLSFPDMIVHKCHDLYRVCSALSDQSELLATLPVPQEGISRNTAILAVFPLRDALALLESIGVNSGPFYQDVWSVCTDVNAVISENWNISGVRTDLLARDMKRIRDGIMHQLKAQKFVYIPGPGDKLMSNTQIFGEDVYDAFPSARLDIEEAGNAFAFELYTSCIYHLMCAAEYAMRALAKDRRIVLTTKGGNPFPADLATWEEVIRELEKETAKIANWPRSKGEVRSQAQEFYNAAVEELRAIKDAWRNPVMHSRRRYKEKEAKRAMDHVEHFMNALCTRITEKKRTPVIWTTAQLR
jgi:hypothetical protein